MFTNSTDILNNTDKEYTLKDVTQWRFLPFKECQICFYSASDSVLKKLKISRLAEGSTWKLTPIMKPDNYGLPRILGFKVEMKLILIHTDFDTLSSVMYEITSRPYRWQDVHILMSNGDGLTAMDSWGGADSTLVLVLPGYASNHSIGGTFEFEQQADSPTLTLNITGTFDKTLFGADSPFYQHF